MSRICGFRKENNEYRRRSRSVDGSASLVRSCASIPVKPASSTMDSTSGHDSMEGRRQFHSRAASSASCPSGRGSFRLVQSNINLTGHITNSTFTVVSGIRLARLSAEHKAALVGVLKETADWVTDQIVKSENDLVGWFRSKGTKVNVVDRAPFIKAVAPALTAGKLPFSKEQYNRLQAIPDAK